MDVGGAEETEDGVPAQRTDSEGSDYTPGRKKKKRGSSGKEKKRSSAGTDRSSSKKKDPEPDEDEDDDDDDGSVRKTRQFLSTYICTDNSLVLKKQTCRCVDEGVSLQVQTIKWHKGIPPVPHHKIKKQLVALERVCRSQFFQTGSSLLKWSGSCVFDYCTRLIVCV